MATLRKVAEEGYKRTQVGLKDFTTNHSLILFPRLGWSQNLFTFASYKPGALCNVRFCQRKPEPLVPQPPHLLIHPTMLFSTRAVLSAVVAVALAPAAVFAQTTHNVVVGASGLTFTPNQVTAAVGDVVAFEFHPKNHTLTQSTFANPCTAMAGGVNSGYMPVAATATTFPVYSFKVNEVTPLWFYCAQTGHCQGGMVFAINVNASSPNTFDAFLNNAKGGSAAPAAGGGYGSASPAATASGSGASSAPAASQTSKTNSAGHLAIGGASVLVTALGVAAGLVL
ncbi:hypothetical protein FRB99_003254 [Tulasnella sp. 403]|nr:hypothetical protein FRB99_003254 [Tulasnella sp. 403]